MIVDLDQPVLMVAIGNGPTRRRRRRADARGGPEDGKVDVMISRAVGPLARFGYAAQLARRRHHERDDVIYLRGARVSISGEEFYCAADGEIYGPERHRTWHVEPGGVLHGPARTGG